MYAKVLLLVAVAVASACAGPVRNRRSENPLESAISLSGFPGQNQNAPIADKIKESAQSALPSDGFTGVVDKLKDLQKSAPSPSSIFSQFSSMVKSAQGEGAKAAENLQKSASDNANSAKESGEAGFGSVRKAAEKAADSVLAGTKKLADATEKAAEEAKKNDSFFASGLSGIASGLNKIAAIKPQAPAAPVPASA